jgi:magnesium chelatase family protein
MLSQVNSATTVGLSSALVEIEVDFIGGLPGVTIVGLPDKAVEESKERVRSALTNSGADFPNRKIIINLAPADIRKIGPSFDLPISLGILTAEGVIRRDLSDSIFLGELSLTGELRPVSGVLPIALWAQEQGFKDIYVPCLNAKEARLADTLKVFPVQSLRQLIDHFLNQEQITPLAFEESVLMGPASPEYDFDMCYIKGQEHVKRALEIAAAGGHNVFMVGVPGSGKTLLARTLASILPAMSRGEVLEVTKIYSIAGMLSPLRPLILERPFRSPHHSTSSIALVGGGASPHPGEISLAHRGVLFLDEFAEFPRSVLEALRQPLEDGVITVSRAQGSLTFPARFSLIASSNPCPCGYAGDPEKNCLCSPSQVLRYHRRVSGPLLDRIDIHVEVPRVKVDQLTNVNLSESSSSIRSRVTRARERQLQRFKEYKLPYNSNAEMGAKDMRSCCALEQNAVEFLRQAISRFHLSARSYHRVLKVGRTIADLAESPEVTFDHLAEAIQYRPKNEEV